MHIVRSEEQDVLVYKELPNELLLRAAHELLNTRLVVRNGTLEIVRTDISDPLFHFGGDHYERRPDDNPTGEDVYHGKGERLIASLHAIPMDLREIPKDTTQEGPPEVLFYSTKLTIEMFGPTSDPKIEFSDGGFARFIVKTDATVTFRLISPTLPQQNVLAKAA